MMISSASPTKLLSLFVTSLFTGTVESSFSQGVILDDLLSSFALSWREHRYFITRISSPYLMTGLYLYVVVVYWSSSRYELWSWSSDFLHPSEDVCSMESSDVSAPSAVYQLQHFVTAITFTFLMFNWNCDVRIIMSSLNYYRIVIICQMIIDFQWKARPVVIYNIIVGLDPLI